MLLKENNWPSQDKLLTALTEVEMILNSRPLSYVLTEDIVQPLTSSHVMTGQRLLSLPEAVHYKKSIETQVNVSVPTEVELQWKQQ